MYVAVKGGEQAIDQAHALMAHRRRGNPGITELSVAQIREQLHLAVDRVMNEGALYDPELAALAIKQASGDLVEAIFLVRAYRTTLPRFGSTEPMDTAAMRAERRVSAIFKDLPGGQLLGPTYDYTHRLLNFALLAEGHDSAPPAEADTESGLLPRVNAIMNNDRLLETEVPGPAAATDLTREPLEFPADRATRLQALARGDEGFLLSLSYSTQRGYGRNHPFAGEIRTGEVALELHPEELGFAVVIGDITVTECDMVNQFALEGADPRFTRGYGLAFGRSERKTMAMALVDRALRARELDEPQDAPAQDEAFVLAHCDNVEASGFVSHLKLPHYVDFQSELALLRQLRDEAKRGNRENDSRPASPNLEEPA
ncbi:carbon-phosphorus lyase complex subunit PhnI [Marinobacter fonticola]|uniref:carbon-phosphorus lyase complex subunit PhnI n=1 Tax=Marinobacter fonticola TaxID=2603215 RepID=UPI0011E85085|nr:carbon-phosphorus lyase complex subunit PhnI [Marinobacter fonticola]